jgi:hypothetical protein
MYQQDAQITSMHARACSKAALFKSNPQATTSCNNQEALNYIRINIATSSQTVLIAALGCIICVCMHAPY